MVWHLKIGNNRLAETLYLDILAVVLSDRHTGVDDVRYDQHPFTYLSLVGRFVLFKLLQLCADSRYLSLDLLGFLFHSLAHETTDLLGHYLSLVSQLVTLCLGSSELSVKVEHLVDQHQLFVLELLSDVFLNELRLRANKFDIQHFLLLLFYPHTAAGFFLKIH